jgi:hypothetical protein
MKPFRAAMLLPLLLLGGCPPHRIYHRVGTASDGVRARPQLDTNCIAAAIARAPGATDVTFAQLDYPREGNTGFPRFIGKLIEHEMIWSYSIGEYRAGVKFRYYSWGTKGERGAFHFSNTYTQHERIAGDLRATVLPVIHAVNRAIEADCAIDLRLR